MFADTAGATRWSASLYEDEGDGYGEAARRTAWCDGRTLRLSARDGGYEAPRERVRGGGASAGGEVVFHEVAESADAADIPIGLPSSHGS